MKRFFPFFPTLSRALRLLPVVLFLLSPAASAETVQSPASVMTAEQETANAGQAPRAELVPSSSISPSSAPSSPSASAMSVPERTAGLASFPDSRASSGAAAGVPNSPGLDVWSAVQTFVALMFILALFFAIAFVLKKFNGGRPFGSNGTMRLLGGIALGTRERIVLLEVGETWLVVGIAPGQIRTLHTMPRGELPASTGRIQQPFSSWLKQFSERRNEKQS